MPFYDTWLDRQVARLGYQKAQPRRVDISTLHAGEAPLLEGDSWNSMTQDDWERLAITSSWVYSDIDLIAKEGARAKLEMHERKGEDLTAIPDHEFEQLMRRPNPFMSNSFLKRYTLSWWLLRGEAYWWLVPDQGGGLAQIWPVPSSRMRPIPDKAEYISAYGYTSKHGEPEVRIPVNQVCFFRLPNPFDFHRGLSPLTAYSMALKTDKGAQKWNQDTFKDGVPFRTILSVPENMSTPNYERLKQEVYDEFEERKRMLLVRGGDLNANELGLSNKDMEFLAGREFTREEIDRVFGVPAGFWAKEATRANTEGARSILIELAVWPLLQMMAEEVDAQVVRRYYEENITVQPEDIRPRDRALLVTERTQYWQVQTVDEAREELGLAPLEDKELGAKLVPLAVKGAPAVPFGGVNPLEKEPEAEEDEEPEKPEELEKDAKADLRRWKSVALRRLKANENPGEYEFESDCIPADVARQVKAMLDGAGSEDEVKAAFAASERTEQAVAQAEESAMLAQIREWYGRANDMVDGADAVKKKSHPAGQP